MKNQKYNSKIEQISMNQQRIIPSWKVVAGHGSHIKATRDLLIIQHQGKGTEILLEDLDHLLIIGGHNIQTSAITTLVNRGIFISFFESDGEPAAYLKPYGYKGLDSIREIRERTSPFNYALTFAKGIARERMRTIERWNEEVSGGILFRAEHDILDRAIHELDNFIKIEEMNRIDRLIGDMYYEIMSRMVPPDLKFKRRTERPYRDPVNAILSFGYAMLTADCTRALIGAHLDPDEGMLNRGKLSLATDFCSCWKTKMIDSVALDLIRNGETIKESYEIGEKRCILGESLIEKLISVFQKSIKKKTIDYQVETFVRALKGEMVFEIHPL
jgi:CRISPR-associated endonuclease Cas1